MHARALLSFVWLALCGCSAPTGGDAATVERPVERYGAPLSTGEPIVSVTELLSTPERHDRTTFVLEGTVDEVCPKKGCWMLFAEGDRSLRVTFQDYGFFVPVDSAGSRVRAQGRFAVVEVPVDEARHYLEDAGRHAEAAAITAPVQSYTFVATGVELVRP